MVMADQGPALAPATTMSRQTVIDAIERGSTFCTVWKPSGGTQWAKGAVVRIVMVRGTKYLRTDANAIEGDNLDNLPPF